MVIRSQISKDRQYNDQTEKEKQKLTMITKHCKEKYRLSNTNPTKIGGEFGCTGMEAAPTPLVAPIVLLLNDANNI